MGTAGREGDLWGRASDVWASTQEPMTRPLWEAMLGAAGVGAGTRVLDAGCGGGGASVLMADRGAEVSGIDAAEELIAIAGRRVPDGDFRVGDIEHLPFEDDAFDAVFAANSVQFAADWAATVCGFERVCRSDGRIVAGLFGPPEQVAFGAILGAVRGALPEPPAGPGPFALSLPGGLEGLFAEVGLEVVEHGEVDCPFRYPDFEVCWHASSSAGPFQAAMQVVGEEQLKASVREAAEAFRLADGAIEIGPNAFHYVVAST